LVVPVQADKSFLDFLPLCRNIFLEKYILTDVVANPGDKVWKLKQPHGDLAVDNLKRFLALSMLNEGSGIKPLMFLRQFNNELMRVEPVGH
jgi:hypothetical protein